MYISPSLLAAKPPSSASTSAPLVLLEFPSTSSPHRLDLPIPYAVLTDALAAISPPSRPLRVACLAISAPTAHLERALPQTATIIDAFSPGVPGDAIRNSATITERAEILGAAFGDAARGGDVDARWVFVIYGMEVASRDGEGVGWLSEVLWRWRGGRVACVVGTWARKADEAHERKLFGVRELAVSRAVAEQCEAERVIVRGVRVRESGRVGLGVRVGVVRGSGVVFREEDAGRVKDVVEAQEGMERMRLSFRVGLSEDERFARSKVEISYKHKDVERADEGLVFHPGALAVGEKRDWDDEDEDDFEDGEDGEDYEEAEDV